MFTDYPLAMTIIFQLDPGAFFVTVVNETRKHASAV